MKSVITIFALLTLSLYIYNYYLTIEKNKKYYIPFDSPSNIEKFTIGGDASYTCNPDAEYGDDNYCLNGGECIDELDEEGNINDKKCKCVSSFSGKYCQRNIGVGVNILDNFTSPTVIKRIPMFNNKGYNYFIQDNDYI